MMDRMDRAQAYCVAEGEEEEGSGGGLEGAGHCFCSFLFRVDGGIEV